ncbi:MAG TPA: succinate dehydrogenase, hydrophobic membrane anchor protein [Rhizomicrobium sp.]|nr:succinate dehydrogenase, hydrophobic membrane anchor protein [Rhizomicrobium sp.]
MSSLQTPLHRVKGLGASHSGTGHFWRERITAAALVPLSLWFLYAVLGLAGTNVVTALRFLAMPWNTLLMAAFVVTALYHAALGLQVVIDDYVHSAGTKILLFLLVRFCVIAAGSTCLFALLRIAAF